MKAYHKVITRVTDKHCRILYCGLVTAPTRPQNTCKESPIADVYEDYFDTYEEAEMFIRTQKKYCY